MSTQKNELYHILSPEWLKTNPLPEDGEFENNDGKWLASSRRGHITPGWNEYPYRTRRTDLPPEAYITPPTDTTGAFPSKEWFEARVDAEADHEVTAGSPDTTGSWREGETAEVESKTFIAGHQDWEGECVTAAFARQLERQRDAALAKNADLLKSENDQLADIEALTSHITTDVDAPETSGSVVEKVEWLLAQVEALRRDGEIVDYLATLWDSEGIGHRLMGKLFLNVNGSFRDAIHHAIDSAQRQEGR